jgi:hypothetical protein
LICTDRENRILTATKQKLLDCIIIIIIVVSAAATTTTTTTTTTTVAVVYQRNSDVQTF